MMNGGGSSIPGVKYRAVDFCVVLLVDSLRSLRRSFRCVVSSFSLNSTLVFLLPLFFDFVSFLCSDRLCQMCVVDSVPERLVSNNRGVCISPQGEGIEDIPKSTTGPAHEVETHSWSSLSWLRWHVA